ncbi:hypothetical protein [Niabella ginsengisoli]|uniref:BZIP domain-containing protein n=1 Tax=Niabella ginsengisoli TaxID=522298 RepID=A0ABS9SMP1_9BACT|nr:hypothetical protein [Niabella ginsengisoli]MCH5599622.1 hypothetical protein [Niabella ginsengisoli]
MLLLYNRKRVRDKNKLRDIKLKQAAAEQKVIDAREKIILFTNNLIEQNNLIKTLQEQLERMQSPSSEATEQLLTKPLLTEEGWETFRLDFSKAYPSFFINFVSNQIILLLQWSGLRHSFSFSLIITR